MAGYGTGQANAAYQTPTECAAERTPEVIEALSSLESALGYSLEQAQLLKKRLGILMRPVPECATDGAVPTYCCALASVIGQRRSNAVSVNEILRDILERLEV